MISYELIFEDRTNYLFVLIAGELNRNIDLEIDAEIKKECKKRKRNKVLIDIRESRSRLTLLQNFVAAKSYWNRMGSYIKAVAIVDSKEHVENSELFEMIAVTRGARLKFFTSTVEAEKWLIEDRD